MLCRVQTVRPVKATGVSVARPSVRVVRMRAQPEQVLQEAIKEAEETCDGGAAGECAAAWDNVEEISAAISHKKTQAEDTKSNDPLEQFCGENPDADECRVYDD
ncbi:MAG: CP12-domain-containing protein [Monoraphidium minutum]|nr:MAG: CP12-domain-containing protein [Monoraphidium minutum]